MKIWRLAFGLRPSHLTLGRVDASIILLSLNRSLITVPDGIYLMSLQCAVEIEFPIGIDITDRHSVWIAIITKQCQCSRCSSLQYANTFFIRKLLTLAPHLTKRRILSRLGRVQSSLALLSLLHHFPEIHIMNIIEVLT